MNKTKQMRLVHLHTDDNREMQFSHGTDTLSAVLLYSFCLFITCLYGMHTSIRRCHNFVVIMVQIHSIICAPKTINIYFMHIILRCCGSKCINTFKYKQT